MSLLGKWQLCVLSLGFHFICHVRGSWTARFRIYDRGNTRLHIFCHNKMYVRIRNRRRNNKSFCLFIR
jgi:hypothetical protein